MALKSSLIFTVIWALLFAGIFARGAGGLPQLMKLIRLDLTGIAPSQLAASLLVSLGLAAVVFFTIF